jgi:5-bromo-4-chloroindolyl phosphate hydrolysis protein
MDFINRRVSSVLGVIFYAVIIIVIIYFFLQVLPFILLAVVIGLASIKGVRVIKTWKSKRRNGGNIVNNVDISETDDLEDLTNKEVIDVDYTDVD